MGDVKRKLASIQKVIDVQPIQGADAIEKITVLGWHLVAKKGEFKVGDLCIYFEIDSLLPIVPQFEFLARGGSIKKVLINGEERQGYRLKTIRLRGQISQGLALPLGSFADKLKIQDVWSEGKDVTELLGVYKYEPPMPATLAGQSKGYLPSYIPKTDEMRLQSYPQLLERYKETPFYVAEKLDGSSMTVWCKEGELNVAGRTINWKPESNNSYWKAAIDAGLTVNPERLGNIALQGELVGEGIQKNTLKIKGQKVVFFNAYDFVQARYLSYREFIDVCKTLGVEHVPIIHTHFKLLETIDELVTFATRKSAINQESWAEGLVFRPLTDMIDPDIGRLSFKVINPEFLLKND